MLNRINSSVKECNNRLDGAINHLEPRIVVGYLGYPTPSLNLGYPRVE